MKRILKELSPFRKEILLLFACVIGYIASNMALPFFLSRIINIAVPARDAGMVYRFGGYMLLFLLFGALCQVLQTYLAAKATAGLARNLRHKVFTKVQSFSETEYQHFTTSSLITRTNQDIALIQQYLAMFLRISLLAPMMFLGGLIMTLYTMPDFTVVLMIIIPILSLLVFLIGKKTSSLSRKMQEKLDQIHLILREKLKGIRVARAFGAEEAEELRFSKSNHDFMKISIRLNALSALTMPLMTLLFSFTILAILLHSVISLTPESATPIGNTVAMIQYVTQIMMSVLFLSMLFVMIPRATVSARRIDEVLSSDSPICDGSQIINPAGSFHLEFNQVGFQFPHADRPALSDISFCARSGEVTAIIGSTGSGKSTLLDLIPRFYDVTQGSIRLQGRDIREYTLDSLRKCIGYVPQSAFLFQGNVKENVDLAANQLSDSEIEEVLQIAQAHDFVMQHDMQLEHPISQGGSNLSGGQKQRLAIARAIAKKPQIYLFDDSFSALDLQTDLRLRKALSERTKEAIVLIVAQRVNTIQNADQILVLEDGKLVGIGNHPELLANCRVYQEIVDSQLERKEA